MTSTPIHDDLTVAYELRVLDALLDDECRCEFDHEWNDDIPCSAVVVAILKCGCPGELVCQNVVETHRREVTELPHMYCIDCMYSVGRWRIIPV